MLRPLAGLFTVALLVPSIHATIVEVPTTRSVTVVPPVPTTAPAAALKVRRATLVPISPPRPAPVVENPNRVIISVREQKLMLLQNGARIATYPVSTSKFGLGDNWGRMTTPLGLLAVAEKIGGHAPSGAVFHNRRFTGEILAPNAPGRDPVITRIIWLRGLELQNSHAFNRCIYIHGTPEEKLIGRPASYGCIRMKSGDITALYNQLPLGSVVEIVPDKLPSVSKANRAPTGNPITSPPPKSAAAPILVASGRGA